jgi:hypothetical protein
VVRTSSVGRPGREDARPLGALPEYKEPAMQFRGHCVNHMTTVNTTAPNVLARKKCSLLIGYLKCLTLKMKIETEITSVAGTDYANCVKQFTVTNYFHKPLSGQQMTTIMLNTFTLQGGGGRAGYGRTASIR